MSWISVKDRLPEQGDTVLVWTMQVDGEINYFDDEPSVVKVCFKSVEDSPLAELQCYYLCAVGITHWMPLPEPPK